MCGIFNEHMSFSYFSPTPCIDIPYEFERNFSNTGTQSKLKHSITNAFGVKEKMKYNSEGKGEAKVKEVSCNQLDKEGGQNHGGIPKYDTNDGLDEDLEDSQHLVTSSAFLRTANFFQIHIQSQRFFSSVSSASVPFI